MEVTGTANLAEKFPDALPGEVDQDAFIKEVCNRMTDAYLAPVQLRDTTLTLIYNTVLLPSWTAGSREVSCSIGATLGNGGWATLINTAKGPLLINGQPPIPPPSIPEERLNIPMPPLPQGSAPTPPANPGLYQQAQQQPQQAQQQPQQPQQQQHLPQQSAPAVRQEPAPVAPPPPLPPSDDLGDVPPPAELPAPVISEPVLAQA
jgi:hypothetical protein